MHPRDNTVYAYSRKSVEGISIWWPEGEMQQSFSKKLHFVALKMNSMDASQFKGVGDYCYKKVIASLSVVPEGAVPVW